MRNKIVCILICMLFSSMAYPVLSINCYETSDHMNYLSFGLEDKNEYHKSTETKGSEILIYDDQLDQKQDKKDNFFWGVGGDSMLAQSFKPTLEVLTRIELRIKRVGNPDGLTISIRDDLNSEDLTSKYIAAGSIPTSQDWIEFDFTDIGVTPENTYYIVWDPVGSPDSGNSIYWELGDRNPYTRGSAWQYTSGEWNELVYIDYPPYEINNPDFCFKSYGFANERPNKPGTPSGPVFGDIGENLEYTSYIYDPDDNIVDVFFDWGDGTNSGWISGISDGLTTQSHSWSQSGKYEVKVRAKDAYSYSEWSDGLLVTIGNVAPNKPTKPEGPNTGKPGTSYEYSSSAIDQNGDQIYFMFDWDDGSFSDWIGPLDSGSSASVSHTWDSKGTYSIKVKCKDTNNAESVWSDPLKVSLAKSKINFNYFLNNFGNNFLLNKIMEILLK